jgi:hypothetical protein
MTAAKVNRKSEMISPTTKARKTLGLWPGCIAIVTAVNATSRYTAVTAKQFRIRRGCERPQRLQRDQAGDRCDHRGGEERQTEMRENRVLLRQVHTHQVQEQVGEGHPGSQHEQQSSQCHCVELHADQHTVLIVNRQVIVDDQ